MADRASLHHLFPLKWKVMQMPKSTLSPRRNKPAAAEKPDKPYEGFPLTPHGNGQWCRKIRGTIHYFGAWDDPQAALEEHNRQWPFLSEGRTPPVVSGDGCTVVELCDEFLCSKQALLDNEELSPTSFVDYRRTADRVVECFGRDRRVDDLRPEDFARLREKLAKRGGIVTLRNEINRCRVIFKFAVEHGLIDKRAEYGQSFTKPGQRVLRKARREAGPRLFTADEIRRIIDAADVVTKAMVLLGINCGFGNTDVSSLPKTAIDFETGWIDYPRPKTEVDRRIPLWPETVESLRKAIAVRPRHKSVDDADLCFLTVQRNRWVRTTPSENSKHGFITVNTIAGRFGALLHKLEVNGRKGLGFYTLRHTFETQAGESKDQVAVDAIMGHVDSSMAGVYREGISDDRLRAVTDTVRVWLFPAETTEAREGGEA